MFDEINVLLAILALLASLGYPLWILAVTVWLYIFVNDEQ